jgi:glycosyltransferase involved in cell wall biosynthesis
MPTSRITTGFMAADTAALAKQCEAISDVGREVLRAQWQAEGVVFLFIGQLIKRKGVGPLLTAWARFERTMPGAGTLVIAGTGPEEEVLKQQSNDLNLNAVRFLGHIDYDHVALHYASADVLLMPTLEDNWSLVVPEAMACGLPVLTSYYNGCWPELVQTDVNGWVFDSLDTEDVVRCLTMCVMQQDQLPQMGQASKKIVSYHTPWHSAQAILQACEIALRHTGNACDVT